MVERSVISQVKYVFLKHPLLILLVLICSAILEMDIPILQLLIPMIIYFLGSIYIEFRAAKLTLGFENKAIEDFKKFHLKIFARFFIRYVLLIILHIIIGTVLFSIFFFLIGFSSSEDSFFLFYLDEAIEYTSLLVLFLTWIFIALIWGTILPATVYYDYKGDKITTDGFWVAFQRAKRQFKTIFMQILKHILPIILLGIILLFFTNPSIYDDMIAPSEQYQNITIFKFLGVFVYNFFLLLSYITLQVILSKAFLKDIEENTPEPA